MKRAINFSVVVAIVAACASSLYVVRDYPTYEHLAQADPDKRLVDVESLGIPIDVRYATSNNFMHARLYPIAKVFLRAPAANALADVERDLAAEHLGVKVFDGYRPYSVTKKMWEPIRN